VTGNFRTGRGTLRVLGYLVVLSLGLTNCSRSDEVIDRKGLAIGKNEDILRNVVIDSTDKVPPDPPENFTVLGVTPFTVRLQWSAALDSSVPDRIAYYRLYRKDQLVAEIPGSVLGYEDSGLAQNTEYRFAMSAVDWGGNESQKTVPVTATTKAIDGASLYATNCENCHGELASSTKKGSTAEKITNAILLVPSMASLKNVISPENIILIAKALSPQGQALSDAEPPKLFVALPTSPTGAVMSWEPKATRNSGFNLLGYRIYRDGQKIATLGAGDLSYSDETLSAGKTYKFQVSAFYTGDLETTKSQEVLVKTPQSDNPQSVPTAPKNLTGKALSATSLEISWQQDSSTSPLAGYHISINGARVATVLPTVTKTVLYQLMSRSVHQVTMVSYSATGSVSTVLGPIDVTTPAADGAQLFAAHCVSCHLQASKANRMASEIQAAIQNVPSMNSLTNLGADDIGAIAQFLRPIPDTTPPTIPTQLSLSNATTQSLTLSWQGSTDAGGSALKGYRIFRNDTLVTQVDASVTSYLNTGLMPDTMYTYKVTAIDFANNESAPSGTVTGKTLPLPPQPDTEKPTAPTGLTSTSIKAKEVTITWLASTDTGGSGINEYKIYRDNVLATKTDAATRSWTDTSLMPDTTYRYKVVCADGAGNESLPSSEIAVKTLPMPSGAQLYSDFCAGCHQDLERSTKRNRTLVQINTAISTISAMASLSSLLEEERRLISEALKDAPPPPGASAFDYSLPLGTRLLVQSRLARVFQNPSSPRPEITSLYQEIVIKTGALGGPCNHYDKACPSGLAPSITTAESSMMPAVSVSRFGYRNRACGALTSLDLAVTTALQNSTVDPTSQINDAAIDRIYGLFYPGKIPQASVKNALTSLFQQAKSQTSPALTLNGWRMVLYSLCTSPEFDAF